MKRIAQFHPAQWNEPLIMTMGKEGERGIQIPPSGEKISTAAGNALEQIPASIRRKARPNLPEVSQPGVYRHYLRLSQMTMGQALTPDISQGTCTMKYSPVINEKICSFPQMTELHPAQDVSTLQGILEITYKVQEMLKEISGMSAISLQPAGGSQAIYTNACIFRAYHASRGEAELRNEIISTAYSHPADCAAPHTAGFKVITLYPDEKTGYPSVESLKAAISEHTAGLMITNPEDTGIYNPNIEEFVRIVHEAGGLCAYDQANANGILGVARARDAGFDACHFNLHKTFSSPHGSVGPGCGATCVSAELEPFLPMPVVKEEDGQYYLDYDRPLSIGKVRSDLGVLQVVLRAYAWIMSLGADGLRKAAELSVLNNNYLTKKMLEIPGVGLTYPESRARLEQTRYTFQKMFEDTGVTGDAVKRRIVDYGLQTFHETHYPLITPNACTFEPTETYSKADMDYYVEVMREISYDAYNDAEKVKNAPERGLCSFLEDEEVGSNEKTRALTWAAYCRKHGPEI